MMHQELTNRLALALLARVELFMAEHDSMMNRRIGHPEGWLQPADDTAFFALHFSSDHVGEKVLTNDEFWLMDATTSNDREERLDGLRVMWDTLDKGWDLSLEEAQALSSSVRDLYDFRPAQLHRMGLVLRGALLQENHPVGLVLCLSKPLPQERHVFGDWHPTPFDNLVMWREYGSDGDGIALGLDAGALVAPLRAAGCELLSVQYDLLKKERACRYLTVACLELLRERNHRAMRTRYMANVPEGIWITTGQAMVAAKLAAGMMSFLFKHPAFAYERETRLLCCRPLIDVRTFENPRTGVRRYYVSTRDLGHQGELPITSVCLGPRASNESRKRIEELCARRSITLTHSDLPYRGRDPGQLDLSEFDEKKRKEDLYVRSDEYRSARSSCLQVRDRHWIRMEDQARKWNEGNLPPENGRNA